MYLGLIWGLIFILLLGIEILNLCRFLDSFFGVEMGLIYIFF